MGETREDDDCNLEIVSWDNVGNKFYHGVAIDVGHKPEESLFLEVASPVVGIIGSLASLDADAARCIIAARFIPSLRHQANRTMTSPIEPAMKSTTSVQWRPSPGAWQSFKIECSPVARPCQKSYPISA